MFENWQRDYSSVVYDYTAQLSALNHSSIQALNDLFNALSECGKLNRQSVSAVLAKLSIIVSLRNWGVPLLKQGSGVDKDVVLLLILSDAPLREDRRRVQAMLKDVLSNPLSQAIFNELGRVENAYCGDQEHPENNHPLNASCANDIIKGVLNESTLEGRVKFFFDFWIGDRFIPSGQMELQEMVDWLSLEEEPNSLADVLVRQAIAGADLSHDTPETKEDWFEHIKFTVAANIIREDSYTTSRFDALMQQVREAIARAVSPRKQDGNLQETSLVCSQDYDVPEEVTKPENARQTQQDSRPPFLAPLPKRVKRNLDGLPVTAELKKLKIDNVISEKEAGVIEGNRDDREESQSALFTTLA